MAEPAVSTGRLAGRVCVVTGAAAGIGAGCAAEFRRQGAIVIGLDRHGADHALDLTDEEQVARVFARIGAEHGRIDALVAAAAFAEFAWLEDMTLAQWRRTLVGELDIVFLPVRAAWPWLKAGGAAHGDGRGGASVITFASANAAHALDGSPALAHCAGKGGVLAMTRQLAMEGAPHGIRANAIAPGFIRTEATARHLAADPGFAAQVLAKNMLKRLGEPEDIAHAAVWLASAEARYVTGANIPVDAGATAW